MRFVLVYHFIFKRPLINGPQRSLNEWPAHNAADCAGYDDDVVDFYSQ